jgi:hypothetical protein
LPADSEVVEYTAVPDDNAPVPRTFGGVVLVSLNCTVPVAVFGVTVAVKVTCWPDVDGFCDDNTVVVVDCKTLYVAESVLFLLSVADIVCGPVLADDGILIVEENAPDELLVVVVIVDPSIAIVIVEPGVKFIPLMVVVEPADPLVEVKLIESNALNNESAPELFPHKLLFE